MSERSNPYVGPRSFGVGEKLFGRARETAELIDLLIAERIVLMSSPSGAGKSSLINAAVNPLMREHGFDVYPPMRVGRSLPPNVAAPPDANRFVVSLLLSLEEAQAAERRLPLDALMRMTFEDYLAHRKKVDAASDSVLLVFDQFEEILTVDPSRRAAKQEFFDQVGRALRDRTRWALFAMREEYVAALMPYGRSIPTRLATSFRLDLLGKAAAMEAIAEPAREGGVAFEPTAVVQLERFLSLVRVQQPDGTTTEEEGAYVEPVQLQVVCRRLWDTLPAGATTVTAEHVRSVGQVERALADYYEDVVGAAAGLPGGSERAIREWVEKGLITPSGIRGEVMQTPKASTGLDNAVIAALVDGYLVREDKRRGNTWYELAHDRLIEPVRISNASWFEENLHPMQRQAALWEQEGRPDRLLLRARDLKAAQIWARANDALLLAVERDFLARSARQRKATWAKQGAVVVFIALLVVGLAATTVLRREALENYRHARADNLAFIASELIRAGDTTRGLRVGQAAYEIDAAFPHVRQVLRDGYKKASLEKSALYEDIFRHSNDVTFVVYSPDGLRIVTTSRDGTAKLWEKGRLVAEMKHVDQDGEPQAIVRAVFTHSGDRIVTIGDGHLAKMWDANGTYIKDLVGHDCARGFCAVTDVAIAPDDRTIVTVGDDQRAILWNRDGDKIKELDEHRVLNGWVRTVAFSPDGKYFATAGTDWDRTVQLYTADGGHVAALPEGECAKRDHWACGAFALAFSPDGRLLLTGTESGAVNMYDLNGKLLQRLTGHSDAVNSLAFSPDSRSFLSASNDQRAILWDSDGRKIGELKGHAEAVTRAVFSPDGKYVVTASHDGTARLWDLDGNVRAIYGGHKAGIDWVAFSLDGRHLVTASRDKTAIQWTAQPLQPTILKHDGEVVTARYLPDGKRILTAANDMTVRLWDAADVTRPIKAYDKLFGPDRYNNKRIWSLDVSADGERFVTAGTDYTVRIWEVGSGRVIKQWLDDEGCNPDGWCGPTNARYSPDGRFIVTADFAGTVKIFDKEGTFLRDIAAHEAETDGIAVSHDGKRLVTGSHDKTVKLWDFATGTLLRTMTGHAGSVLWVSFSDKDDRIASASADQTVKLWDLQGSMRNIDAHAGPVQSVEFSPDPDKREIVSASLDGKAKIWGVAGRLMSTLNGHTKFLRSACFSPTGDDIITASGDTTAIIWRGPGSIHRWLRGADIYRLTADDWREFGVEDPPP